LVAPRVTEPIRRVRCVWGDYEGDGGGNAAAKPAACAVMVAATGGVHTTAARRPRARRPPSAAAPRWGRPPPLAGPGGHGLACGSDADRPPDRIAGHSSSHDQRSRRARRHRRVLPPYVRGGSWCASSRLSLDTRHQPLWGATYHRSRHCRYRVPVESATAQRCLSRRSNCSLTIATSIFEPAGQSTARARQSRKIQTGQDLIVNGGPRICQASVQSVSILVTSFAMQGWITMNAVDRPLRCNQGRSWRPIVIFCTINRGY